MKYLQNLYIKTSEKNKSYYFIFFISFLLSFFLLLGVEYTFFHETGLLKDNDNRQILVSSHYMGDELLKEIKNYEHVQEVKILSKDENEWKISIIVNSFDKIDYVTNFLTGNGFSITIPTKVFDYKLQIKIVAIVRVVLILLFILIIIINLLIIRIILCKEQNKIFLLKALGFSLNNISTIIYNITFKLISFFSCLSFVVYLFMIIISRLFFQSYFFLSNYVIKVFIILIAYLCHVLIYFIFEKKYVKIQYKKIWV